MQKQISHLNKKGLQVKGHFDLAMMSCTRDSWVGEDLSQPGILKEHGKRSIREHKSHSTSRLPMKDSHKFSKRFEILRIETIAKKARQGEMNYFERIRRVSWLTFPKAEKFLDMWVFKLKRYGEKLLKYKAHMVPKSFEQNEWIGLDGIFFRLRKWVLFELFCVK